MKILIKLIIFFCTTLSTSLFSLTSSSTLMVNSEYGKRILLIDCVHHQYIKMTGDTELISESEQLYECQKKELVNLANTIFNFDKTTGSKTVIITELNDNSMGRIIEEEIELVKPDDEYETIKILPRMFIRNIMPTGSSSDEKINGLAHKIEPFNTTTAVSFTINNQARFILGDRRRDNIDTFLALDLYKNWKEIKKENLSSELEELSIEYVKNYIQSIHNECLNYTIADRHAQKALDIINTTLHNSSISKSDHISDFHAYLAKSNQEKTRNSFNDNLLKCLSHKFDFELCDYIEEFEKDLSLKYMIIQAGSAHTEEMALYLATHGYKSVEKNGASIEDESTIQSANQLKDYIKQMFNSLKNNNPLANIMNLFN